MQLLNRSSLIIALAMLSSFSAADLSAQEPGWTSRVLKVGPEREVSEQTPILERPYRPLHFYGNAVRRNHYRGNPLPMPRDVLITGAFLAPSSRERDEERVQRLGGYDYRRNDQENSEQEKQASDEAGSENLEMEAAPNEEPIAEETATEQAVSKENSTAASEKSRQSSRRPGLDAQARRSRRGN